MTKQPETRGTAGFRIFRRSGARTCDLMTSGDDILQTDLEDGDAPTLNAGDDIALDQGHDLKVLFDVPGLSLVRAWFKSEFPLPRHTHNVDCVYYIVGGSLRMGDEELRAGDGFFVGAGVPYTYTPGPEGLEILEFRPSNAFDIKIKGDPIKLRQKSFDKMTRRQDAWSKEVQPPSR